MTPSRRLPGVLALDGGECPRCRTEIVPGRDRVVFVAGRTIHLACHKDTDKEYR